MLDWLINEQISDGHDVTLFASGDSKTAARLIPVIPKALWHMENIEFPNTYHTIELDMVDKMSNDFDIIHSHFNFIHFQSINRIKTPMITTLHWRVDIREFQDLYDYFNKAPLVAISHSQKSFIPQANVIDVVYHGLPADDYPFNERGGDYIAFLGRFCPEKGVHIALDVAKKLQMPIKIGARIPEREADLIYYRDKIKPYFDSEIIEYVGELNEHEKRDLLKNAKVTIVPTNWPEPFGLVTVESLVCGTPVVALSIGGTAEILNDGQVGFVSDSIHGLIEGIKNIDKISRTKCRRYVVEKFSSSVMAKNYEKVYKKILSGS